MAAAEVVRARLDPELKRNASAVLSEKGLSVSDPIRLLFLRIDAEKPLPFDIRVPNAETQAALRAVEKGDVTRFDNVEALMADLND
jgi:DNA-damage-inducible protein J